jgi:sodium-coupled monocarboxylate transporter 8/12
MNSTSATIASLRLNTFHAFDYVVFGLFLCSSAVIGAFFGWKGRNSKNNKDFLTGNRNLQMFPVVMSLAASFMSTNTILGVPAEVYTLGTQFVINIVSITIAIFLSAEVFMPVFYDLNMVSVNEVCYSLQTFLGNAYFSSVLFKATFVCAEHHSPPKGL